MEENLGSHKIIHINSEHKLEISKQLPFSSSLGLILTTREPIQFEIGQGIPRCLALRELSGGTLPFPKSDSAD